MLLNKPFGVLCQFTGDGARPTLAGFRARARRLSGGRLDADSEGLVVLTADGALQARISSPRHKLAEDLLGAGRRHRRRRRSSPRSPTASTCRRRHPRPRDARAIAEPPALWPREPPIRVRRAIPTSWLELALTEGRNRQVRRMTAAVGLPTLRLIRCAVGPWTLDGLAPGQWREAAGGGSRAMHPRPSAAHVAPAPGASRSCALRRTRR